MWTLESGVGATFVDATLSTTTVENLVAGQCYTLRWTVTSSNGTCTAYDEMEICIDEQPTASANDDQFICSTSTSLDANVSTLVSATTGENASGVWTFTGGTGYPDPDIDFTSTDAATLLTDLKGGMTYEFTWTITNGECTSSDVVLITVDAEPLLSLIHI